jgi:hypothetical protein
MSSMRMATRPAAHDDPHEVRLAGADGHEVDDVTTPSSVSNSVSSTSVSPR